VLKNILSLQREDRKEVVYYCLHYHYHLQEEGEVRRSRRCSHHQYQDKCPHRLLDFGILVRIEG